MKNSLLLPIVKESLSKYGLKHRIIECDPEAADTAAFCEKYGFTAEQSANAIIVMSRKVEPPKYALCVVLANTRLDVNKAVVKELGVKRASFADAETTKGLTGMMIGGVTAPGVESMPIYVDSAVMNASEVVMGGGNRSSKIVLNPEELEKLPNVEVVEGLAKQAELA